MNYMFFFVNYTSFIVNDQFFILDVMRRVNPEFGYLSIIAFARSAPTISFSDRLVLGTIGPKVITPKAQS